MTLTKLEVLKKQRFPGHDDQIIHIKYLLSYEGGLTIEKHPKENETIEYPYEYHRMVVTDFERKEGTEGLIFTNKDIIEKQRAVMGFLIKKIGSNFLSGKSIMSVSLPINIFDVRSHLEV
jgi:mevalonate kinase